MADSLLAKQWSATFFIKIITDLQHLDQPVPAVPHGKTHTNVANQTGFAEKEKRFNYFVLEIWMCKENTVLCFRVCV